MRERIKQLMDEVKKASPTGAEAIEAFRIKYLGRKGELKALAEDFKSVANDQKREMGQLLNELKKNITAKVEELKNAGEEQTSAATGEDLTRPHGDLPIGPFLAFGRWQQI